MRICNHCDWPIKIKDGSGYCDHLYYPTQCPECLESGDIDKPTWHEGDFIVICPKADNCDECFITDSDDDDESCVHGKPHTYIEKNEDGYSPCIDESYSIECPNCVPYATNHFLSKEEMEL